MTSDLFHNTKMIQYSLGTGDNLGKSKNTKENLRKFKARFKKPHVTDEKMVEYQSGSDKRQRYLKGIAGWMMRGMVEKGQNRNRKSIMPSGIITLDMDYGTPEFVELLLAGKLLPGVHLMAHSTRSHVPQTPRIRIVIFLSKSLDRERYQAASRIVSNLLDPDGVWTDKVSFRPAQMMYMPTCSSDMEDAYIYHEQPGDLLDHEDMIDTWEMTNGSANDIGNLPTVAGEHALRDSEEQMENPLEKKGPVGNFCRAYSITELVMGKDGEPGLLEDTYEVVSWSNGAIARMTYKGGTTSNGAVVYDDLTVHSHHGSDPCGDMSVNAFDLVRMHKFGGEDKKTEHDTPMGKMPSFKAMQSFIKDDEHYRAAARQSKGRDIDEIYAQLDTIAEEEGFEPEIDESAMTATERARQRLIRGDAEAERQEIEDSYAELIADVPEGDDEDLIGTPRKRTRTGRAARQHTRASWIGKPKKNWSSRVLELGLEGIIKSTIPNAGSILAFDPRFHRKIAFNQFSQSVVAVGDLDSKMDVVGKYQCLDPINGDEWTDRMELLVRAVLENDTGSAGSNMPGYGLKATKDLTVAGVELAAYRNQFHPILEYLDSVRSVEDLAPDRPDLIERLFIDYYHTPDTEYYRELSRLVLIASVARVEEPGCKFDTAIVLEGVQGTGKSSSISILYGEDYFGELDVDLGNTQKVAEVIGGKWCLELAEMSAIGKSGANEAKAFLSRAVDKVRMPYKRLAESFRRQCVVWGTTNEKKHLRDHTGGRRYLIVECGDGFLRLDALAADRDALWQAATAGYDEMRAVQPTGWLHLDLTGEAAQEAKRLQERARKRDAWEGWLHSILEWMDDEKTLQEFLAQSDVHSIDEDAIGSSFDGLPMDTIVCRVATWQEEALSTILGMYGNVPGNEQSSQFWEKVKSELIHLGWALGRVRVHGKQRTWIIRPDATEEEKARGFRVLNIGSDPLDGLLEDDDGENMI